MRVDLNVPVRGGTVTDATRIEAIKPTVTHLLEAGAKVILLAHLGRPGGRLDKTLSLAQILPALEQGLGQKVTFAGDALAKETAKKIDQADGIVLLENIRFHPGESSNDPAFSKRIAQLGDVYINDAFSTAHRAHASTEGLAHLLPAAAGFAFVREIEELESAFEAPRPPVCAVIGGAKVSSKIHILENLAKKMDHIIIGGAMANTFLLASGYEVGKSLCERDLTDVANSILEKAKHSGCKIHLPSEVVVAKEFRAGAAAIAVPVAMVEDDDLILDIGPKSVDQFMRVLRGCKTALWNGPLGAFEVPPFDFGTTAVAKGAAELTKKGRLVTIAGGGDTVAALAHAGVRDQFSYVSTAGGAFLELLEGKTLPAVAALML